MTLNKFTDGLSSKEMNKIRKSANVSTLLFELIISEELIQSKVVDSCAHNITQTKYKGQRWEPEIGNKFLASNDSIFIELKMTKHYFKYCNH